MNTFEEQDAVDKGAFYEWGKYCIYRSVRSLF